MNLFADVVLRLALKFPRFESIAISYFMKSGGAICSVNLRKLFLKLHKIDVGLYTYGCFRPDFNFGGNKISIGRYCSFASGVRFLGANHPIERFSSSAIFYNKALGYNVKDVLRHNLVIEDDVWIGLNAIITCGCKRIGRGAIIGAGRLVTKDVEPYTIVGGSPAKVIRKRFDEERIKKLEASRWWEKTPEQLIVEFEDEIYEKD